MPKIRRINPEGMHPTPGYAHVTIAEGNRRAYLAGQCPLDVDGTLVGVGDIDAQVDQVINNSLKALAHVDAAPDRVIRSVIYVASPDRADLARVWDRFTHSALAPAFSTASTLLGVAQLGYEGQLVELDLTALLDSFF
jgi:enamine deaminase RidA (YjgF/YER057c/UK114 family)